MKHRDDEQLTFPSFKAGPILSSGFEERLMKARKSYRESRIVYAELYCLSGPPVVRIWKVDCESEARRIAFEWLAKSRNLHMKAAVGW
jgi:hypothetical protein